MDNSGADLDRVRVWDAFSEMFLDSYRNDNELDRLAEIIANSPFSLAELGHILFKEVAPVCFPNLLMLAGEWAGFDHGWLIEKCLARQKKNPFSAKGNPDKLPGYVHFFSPVNRDAYLLLCRVKSLREARRGSSTLS
jgi:hypothetical protein